MKPFEKYLKERGLDHVKDAQRAALHKEYRRLYFAEYRKNYRGKHQRVEVVLINDEYKRLQERAEKLYLQVSTYIKTTSLAYSEGRFLLPDRDMLDRLVRQLRALGNNLNQLAYVANATKSATLQDFEAAYQILEKVEAAVIDAISRPPDLLASIAAALDKVPELAGEIEQLLNNRKKDTHALH